MWQRVVDAAIDIFVCAAIGAYVFAIGTIVGQYIA
jgi:hypothetical protein